MATKEITNTAMVSKAIIVSEYIVATMRSKLIVTM
jgi:hypothetical protein